MAKGKKEDKERKNKASGKGERFADMSADAVVIDEAKIAQEAIGEVEGEEEKPIREPKVRGKKYQAAKKKVESGRAYPIKEAIALLKEISFGKFKGAVEAHLNVTQKGLSGEAALPHFSGKQRKVAIFSDELAQEIKSGQVNFDVLLASPADMPKILPLAKTLGPRGLMPNPKNGTLSSNPRQAAEKFSGNALFFKTEKDYPIIHAVIGKIDQDDKELIENFEALIKAVNPKNIKKAVVKSTMSPSLKIAL
jgi:large subunit ribosomal protein L1